MIIVIVVVIVIKDSVKFKRTSGIRNQSGLKLLHSHLQCVILFTIAVNNFINILAVKH